MTNDQRFVADTNVVVSALLLPTSTPRKALDRALAHGKLLISFATVAELHEVINRPKFGKYVSEENRVAFLTALVREAELVDVSGFITDAAIRKIINSWNWRSAARHHASFRATKIS